ncbi:thiamine-monophosphate kinase [Methylobacterium sp. Leaf469]|uniref:thiamine-phosphate kinase n=1 Tax=unclassified Methylobacterium TaxID=2615210 RepID=UPI0006F7AC1A|nr:MULTISPECIES: thiamine-phosphate kinase [unclassified Methylobacterium]KQP32152.1 thiamine-monophosphate kinase [Methylobacterium sp. Leaf100]KQT98975.1 thiamine-monophosphate kinase [Methylobacterium sp. Leaf469]
MSRDRPTEDGLIARYFAPLAGPGADGMRDDAATLTPTPGHDLVLTADAIVAGVHFFPDDPPSSIARKAVGVNFSDLAAKGAAPRGILLTLALPDDWTEAWLAAFATGLGDALSAFGGALLGGDTVRAAGPLSVGVTALGEVPAGTMVRRMTAAIGDVLCVSGTIGDAALGLPLCRSPLPDWGDAIGAADRAALVARYRHPRPRLGLAPVLRRHARAAMDISDGLAGDLAKMLKGEGRCALVRLADVPLSQAAASAAAHAPDLMDTIVTGGDDYEILCAVPPESLAAIRAGAEAVGIPLHPIGTVLAGDGPPVFEAADGARKTYAAASFSHF